MFDCSIQQITSFSVGEVHIVHISCCFLMSLINRFALERSHSTTDKVKTFSFMPTCQRYLLMWCKFLIIHLRPTRYLLELIMDSTIYILVNLRLYSALFVPCVTCTHLVPRSALCTTPRPLALSSIYSVVWMAQAA